MRCPTLAELPPPPDRTRWPWTAESPQLPDTMPDGSPWPRISIVTPSYNQGQFVEETIRSVLLQGYPDLEYIIMDGGSTDGSADIIRRYEPWLACWASEPDRGQSHAINKGWRRATGEILAWLNSDDTYEPGAIGKGAEFLGTHPNTAMIYGDCHRVDETGRIIGPFSTMSFDLAALVCNQPFIPQQTVLVRQKAIEAAGGTNEDLHVVMDWELWLRIARAGFEIGHIAQVMARFRRYPDAKTSMHVERSGSEKLNVLDALFSDPDLPPNIRSLKKRAYSSVHRFIGMGYYARRRSVEARRHLLKSARLYPSQLRRKRVAKALLSSLIPLPRVQRARRRTDP